MQPLPLPKSILLRKPWEYRAVYGNGRRIRGNHLTIIYAPNGTDQNRLGISIHGIKKAVTRNRIKRIIREFFRSNRSFISPSSDIVFAVRNGFNVDSPLMIKKMIGHMVRSTSTKQSRTESL
ncbi:MAG: ribonuclease P protein component [Proteobacteria bacterium]|nr:ribonuclease P protein component [Pseudomonadota bacterium]MBU1687633.1 ribonuclease P protein component [Pseudomonadota bacterium]